MTIHWASAIAVVLCFAAGFAVANLAPPAVRPEILFAHIVLGGCVLLLTLLRIVWWWLADRRPEPFADQPRWQRVAASAVHGALYVVLLVMAASGIATVVLSGAVPAILSGAGVPDLSAVPPRIVHGLLSKALLLLLVGHVGAALYHQFIRRDRLLARMGVGPA